MALRYVLQVSRPVTCILYLLHQLWLFCTLQLRAQTGRSGYRPDRPGSISSRAELNYWARPGSKSSRAWHRARKYRAGLRLSPARNENDGPSPARPGSMPCLQIRMSLISGVSCHNADTHPALWGEKLVPPLWAQHPS